MISPTGRGGPRRGRSFDAEAGRLGLVRVLAACLLAGWLGPLAAAATEAAAEPSGEAAEAVDEPRRYYGTATVKERPLAAATAAVTVLDRGVIEASGARSVAELLWRVPGVSIANNSARGGLSTAQIRGGDPNFTLVLLDGVPLNDGTYQVGDVFNLEGLSLVGVERIEVVRGPLSAFYGSTGLAGAINIITRAPGASAAAAEVEAGSSNQRRAAARAAGEVGSTGYWLGGSWEEESERIANESFELADVYLNLAGAGDESSWRLGGRAASWNADDYPDASGGPLLGSGELRRSDHEEVSLSFELELGRAQALEQQLVASVYRHRLDRVSPAVFPLVPPATEQTRYTRSRLGWIAGTEPRPGMRLSFGVDLQLEDAENRSVLELPPFLGGDVAGDYELDRLLPGALVELVAERGRLTWELSARVDAPEDAATQFNPRVGIGYRLAGERTRVRASAGRAFKMPSFFALASPPALGGNLDLVPESSIGADLGVQHRFAGGLEAELGVFYQRYEDLIDFDFQIFSHVNRSKVEAKGVESALAWARKRWSVTLNLTWQEVENADTGRGLRQRPEWSGTAVVHFRPTDEVELGLDVAAVSERLDEQIPVPNRDRAGGYAVAGGTATWRPDAAWSLRVRVENLGDNGYETYIGFPGAGRAARLSLRWRPR